MEKKLEGQEDMAVGCIHLDNIHDTIAGEMAMTPLGWMGVREEEARMVEVAFEDTNSKVLRGPGISEEFEVNVGLRQRSAWSPLLLSLWWN